MDLDKKNISVTFASYEGFVKSLKIPHDSANLIQYVRRRFLVSVTSRAYNSNEIMNFKLLYFALWCLAVDAVAENTIVMEGKVMKIGDSVAVFRSDGLFKLPQELQSDLKRYVGRYILLQYSNDTGIAALDQIKVIYRNEDDFPLEVKIAASKREYDFIEPITMSVRIRNRSNNRQMLHLYSSSALILRDLKTVASLTANNFYDENQPFGLARIQPLFPNEILSFTVVSSHYIDPGEYSLLFSVSRLREFHIPSNLPQVKVLPSEKSKMSEALKTWMARSDDQLPDASLRLLSLGDDTGLQLMMKKAQGANFIGGYFGQVLLRHGGIQADEILLEKLRRTDKQLEAWTMIELIPFSDRYVEVIKQVFDITHETRRDISGWNTRPRVCDMLAYWLAGYTKGKITFPSMGSEQERNASLAVIRALFETDPNTFIHSWYRNREQQ